MSKLVNRIAAIAALALAATPIIGLTAAHAAEPATPIARVRVGDLTLSNPADAREFARRAHAAGTRACDAKGFSGLSARACMMDFHQDLQHALTKQQAAQLRVAKRAGA
ncbi:UrcA family protein [Caulobacter sp. FWC2]|uniref:UrcA family protein n=1 Tax=Caulobacter sp. FWC2 TaxID=69664 RepID=UPI000C151E27|nr:UrcA family protein [Caulobacter sp. FWC2]PIB93242.1 UrcA family protein [Caulobacter sp. FWC2]